jgi:hypothetical protein
MGLMSRQINMDIFNESYNPSSMAEKEAYPSFEGERADPHYDEIAGRIEKLRYEVQEWAKSLNLRLEKTTQRVQALEERAVLTARENHEKLATLYSKIKETQNSDFKFASLVERHNQIVQSFELRLTQSQRLIENQAVQLAKQQDLIDDARRQLEKLKRL